MRFSTFSAPAIAALILVASPAAQDTVDRAMVAKIRSEGLDRSKVYATFSHLVTVVGPRLTATPEYKAAADWSREQLASYGLQNPRLEAWDFGRGWQLEKFTLEMIEPRYMPLIGYPEAWSASMSAEVAAAPVSIAGKSPEEIEAMKGQLKGAIVLGQELQTSFVREDRVQPSDAGIPVSPASRRRHRPRSGAWRQCGRR